jgi:DNA helicase-2/ATP-dependent DNA helicase PcrA
MMTRVGEIGPMNARALAAVQKFVSLVQGWRKLTERAAPAGDDMFNPDAAGVKAIMERVVRESGYEKHLQKLDPDEENEIPNVDELISSAAEYDQGNPEGSLMDYLATVSLVSDADHMDGAGGAVTLMTLHAAKGLEFPVVAMIGLEDGVLPHSRSRDSDDELEEERRLCFVGITRAQRKLILSKAQYRTIRGLRERTAASGFLGELPSDALAVSDRTDLSFGRAPLAVEQTIAREQSHRLSTQFQKGQLVRHKTFGVGKITDVVDMGQHTRAVVEFQRVGRKTLILQYAQLEPVA